MQTVALPRIEDKPFLQADDCGDHEGPWIVILYNDDVHSMDEVMFQLQKATGCSLEQAAEVMLEAHCNGRAIAYTGSMVDSERVASVLRAIRLQVETDRF